MYEQANNIGIGASFSVTPLSERITILQPSATALNVACTHFSKERSNPLTPFSILYNVEIVTDLKSECSIFRNLSKSSLEITGF